MLQLILVFYHARIFGSFFLLVTFRVPALLLLALT